MTARTSKTKAGPAAATANPLQGRRRFHDAIEEPLREAQAVAWLMTEALNAIGCASAMRIDQFGMLMSAAGTIQRLTGGAVDAIDSASMDSFCDYRPCQGAL